MLKSHSSSVIFPFILGLDKDITRSMECFDFVCRAPTNLFKSKCTHPPFLRVQSNLYSLLLAANCIDEEEIHGGNLSNVNETSPNNETSCTNETIISPEQIDDKI